jgi:hypothetical protein
LEVVEGVVEVVEIRGRPLEFGAVGRFVLSRNSLRRSLKRARILRLLRSQDEPSDQAKQSDGHENAVLGGFVALGAVASSPSRANSIAAEDSEILALRVEFERVDDTRQPLIDQTNELAWTFTRIVCESGYETARAYGVNRAAFRPSTAILTNSTREPTLSLSAWSRFDR